MNHLLIVGLGNPGSKYEKTRHNIGFMILDEFVGDRHLSWGTDKKSLYAKEMDGSWQIHFLKPQEYMNLSGKETARVLQMFKIPLDHLLVVHDEIDLPFGKIKNKVGGGTAGHNGLGDIVDRTGEKGFHRLRFGVGKPTHPGFAVADYVLQKFSQEESEEISKWIQESKKRIQDWIQERKKNAL